MSGCAKSGLELEVAVTCSRKHYLTKNEADQILVALQKKIMSDACTQDPLKIAIRPTFKAKPLLEDGVIKLWCANDKTTVWLETTISEINTEIKSSPDLRLTIMCQSKVLKRVTGNFEIPNEQRVFKDPADMWRTLRYQNPQIDFDKWEIHSTRLFWGGWDVRVTYPESNGRFLSIGLTEVELTT